MSIREAIRALFQPEKPIELGLKGVTFAGGDEWLLRNGYRGIFAALGSGHGTWSGESVSHETALNHSVVWACNRIISETVGFLPCVMMQAGKGTDKRVAEEHPMYSALKNAPNSEMTAAGFTETETSHCVMGGNSFSKIERRSGTGEAIELYPIHAGRVKVDREKTGQKRLVYVVDKDKTYTVERNKPQDILHIRGIGNDGITGYSVLEKARQSIGTAIAAERNVGAFYARGGRLPYNLKLAQKWKTETDAEKFRADWESTYSQPHKAPILEPNVEYQPSQMSLRDQQLLESRQFSVAEICRWFLVSPHLVGDLSRATFSNIEQLALEFVKLTLATWLTRWEQELWRCVLTPEEKLQGYFWRHNLNALLRGDFATRMAGYATALQNGWLSQNEVRDLEDMNPFEGGDDYHVQLNMQTLPGGTPLAPQQPDIVTN